MGVYVYPKVYTKGEGDNKVIDRNLTKLDDAKYFDNVDFSYLCTECNRKTEWEYVDEKTLLEAKYIKTTKSEYSLSKGIAGAALLGPIGAVAGINGNQKTTLNKLGDDYITITVKCGLCGAKKSFCSHKYWEFLTTGEEIKKSEHDKKIQKYCSYGLVAFVLALVLIMILFSHR